MSSKEQEGQDPEMAMLQAAASTQIFARLLEEYYVPLELWHLKSSIEKVTPTLFRPTRLLNQDSLVGSSTIHHRPS